MTPPWPSEQTSMTVLMLAAVVRATPFAVQSGSPAASTCWTYAPGVPGRESRQAMNAPPEPSAAMTGIACIPDSVHTGAPVGVHWASATAGARQVMASQAARIDVRRAPRDICGLLLPTRAGGQSYTHDVHR